MARTVFFDGKGKRVTLGSRLGSGGEATVYSIEGQRSLVAKVYHRPPAPEKAAKLSRMVDLQSERLLALSAWPVGTLFSTIDHALAGFLMRNVQEFKDIHLLYSPKSRAREFPAKANWRFLLHTASNVARAFSVIHEHGHVIGDVNQSNVRVSPESAVVSLIDCDSFQISDNGRHFLCEVGVPLFTSPELQETEFREVLRTSNHDNFGLAVLIFHLLFMGRHPFAGKFLGPGEMPIEKAIGEFRFAFAPDVDRTQMQPPPSCITLAHLPSEFSDLFTRAFGSDGVQNARPDGRQWISALETLSRQLMICGANRSHLFYNGLASCPWCSIESSGVFLFVDYAIVDAGSGFSLEVVWSRITTIQNPGAGTVPTFRCVASIVNPSPRAKAAAWKRRGKIAVMASAGLAYLGYCLFSDLGFVFLLFLGLVFGLLKSLIGKINQGAEEFARETRGAEANLRNLRHRWQQEASEEVFKGKLQELRVLTDEYRHLGDVRKRKVCELEKALYNLQLRRFLEQFDIASADIPHIKDGRKAMLSAYGIGDAADVSRAAIEAVPGFGEFLIVQLLAWRQSLETKFRFEPGRGIDAADLLRVDHEISKRRVEIEVLLSRGPAELNALRGRIIAARGQLQGQLEKAFQELAQAQADELAVA